MSALDTIIKARQDTRDAFGGWPGSARKYGAQADVPMTPSGTAWGALKAMRQVVNNVVSDREGSEVGEAISEGKGASGFLPGGVTLVNQLDPALRDIATAMGDAALSFSTGTIRSKLADTRAGAFLIMDERETSVFWLALVQAAIVLDGVGVPDQVQREAVREFKADVKQNARQLSQDAGDAAGAISEEFGQLLSRFLGGVFSGAGIIGLGVLYLGWKTLR